MNAASSVLRIQQSTLINLTYISDCLIPAVEHEPSIAALLVQASKFNDTNGVTGALLFTGDHFVQTIEGPSGVVTALMTRIERDPRHQVLQTIDRREVAGRSFKTWSMAYSGSSVFVSREVRRSLMHNRTQRDVNRLLCLLREFTAPPPRPAP